MRNFPVNEVLFHFLKVKSEDISEICSKSAKVDSAKVLSDVQRRQIPRFRDAPPGQSTSAALQEMVTKFECFFPFSIFEILK